MASPQTPATSSPQGLLILWGSVDPASVDERALDDWWTNEHLLERLRLPGFQRARRYRALNRKHGQNEYLALYEASNVWDLASDEYLYALNHPTKRTVQFMPCLAKMSRFACRSVLSKGSPVSISVEPANTQGLLFMVVYQVDNGGLDRDPLRVIGEHLGCGQSGAWAEITYAQLAKVDEEITKIGSASKSYNHVQFRSPQDGKHTDAKKADTFIALFELRPNNTDRLITETSTMSERLSHNRDITGLHINHINAYELIASLSGPLSEC
ncbi:hypothetical protein ACJBU6_04733 [Exserohilum turcicum]